MSCPTCETLPSCACRNEVRAPRKIQLVLIILPVEEPALAKWPTLGGGQAARGLLLRPRGDFLSGFTSLANGLILFYATLVSASIEGAKSFSKEKGAHAESA